MQGIDVRGFCNSGPTLAYFWVFWTRARFVLCSDNSQVTTLKQESLLFTCSCETFVLSNAKQCFSPSQHSILFPLIFLHLRPLFFFPTSALLEVARRR